MTLKLMTDTLEGVPEALHSFYEKGESGYKLKVDGMEDTTGLKSALQKEREAAKEAKRYKELGLSPEEIAELKASRDRMEEDKAKAAGEWDKLREKLSNQHKTELDKIRAELDAIRNSEREARVESSLKSALAEAGATEEGMSLLPDILKARATVETVEGKRVVRVLDADGSPMLAANGKDATLADLAAKASEKYPSLFKARTKAGSGTQPGGSGAGRTEPKEVKASELVGMSPMEKAAFFKANPNIRVTG